MLRNLGFIEKKLSFCLWSFNYYLYFCSDKTNESVLLPNK